MKQNLIVVSNRLPIQVGNDNGTWQITPASGGLVTALEPLMGRYPSTWIGWPGCGDEAPFERLAEEFSATHNYRLQAVPLDEGEIDKYYRGFSNETLWPLFHDLLGNCRFELENFRAYERVNRRFAEVAAAASSREDIVWIHDYQLILSGSYLRQLQPEQTLAFFLHIPFPSPDMFRRLPWFRELLRGLLAYDLVGFQTLRDHRNFVNCVAAFIDEVEISHHQQYYTVLRHQQRYVKAGHFPISIDFNEFSTGADSSEVAQAAADLHDSYGKRQLILGIDRLDYTKGIPERFLAFERALEKYPDMHQNSSLLQVVVPSRTMVPDYIELQHQLEQLAGNINGRFSEHGWIPLHYHFRSLDQVQLLAHYRAVEIALITPLRDGMNLVAKEYCACKNDNRGVLILSKFAGTADELGRNALLVNPYDVEKTADAIYEAFTMAQDERQRRMASLRDQIRRHDVHRWLDDFVAVLDSDHRELPQAIISSFPENRSDEKPYSFPDARFYDCNS